MALTLDLIFMSMATGTRSEIRYETFQNAYFSKYLTCARVMAGPWAKKGKARYAPGRGIGGKMRGNTVMTKTWSALALSLFMSPAGGAMAQSLPDELKPVGSMSYPYNLVVPNYDETPSLLVGRFLLEAVARL